MNFLPKLSSFEGPLDLLLHLIEKNKIDIYDIPIAEITDQYLEYLEGAEEEDTDFLSEFLVMAATLLEIKARMLLPKEEKEDDEGDPRAGLVERLLEYKLFKYMSSELGDLEAGAEKTLYKKASVPQEVLEYAPPPDYDTLLKGVTLRRLSEILSEVLERNRSFMNEEAEKFGKIKKEEISLPSKMDEIRKFLEENPEFSFRALIEKRPTKDNIIVTFLAVLEMMRTGEITACQNGEDIKVIRNPESAAQN